MSKYREHIVIVGAGFGGLYTYRALRALKVRARITLVSNFDFFIFTPLLHEVACGALSPELLCQSLHEIVAPCDSFVHATVSSIDTNLQLIHTNKGDILYDHVVIATGARGSAGDRLHESAQHVMELKSIGDAVAIRNAIRDSLATTGSCRVAIIGGGPTDVELAAELKQMNSVGMQVVLVHGGKRLLERFDERVSAHALERLRQLGVDVRMGYQIQSASPHTLHSEYGDVVEGDVIVWTAGVIAQPPQVLPDVKHSVQGRIETDETLRVGGMLNVWGLGDAAGQWPMHAQAAVRQADVVAYNIAAVLRGKPLRTFHWEARGDLVSLGQWYAVGMVRGWLMRGAFTWWIWRTVYLLHFPSWKKRARVAMAWTRHLVGWRD
jgi:NADH dehydrogenase